MTSSSKGHRCRRLLVLTICLLLLPLVWCTEAIAKSQSEPQEDLTSVDLPDNPPQDSAASILRERRASAHVLDFYAPYYSVSDDVDTDLLLMSTYPDPLSVRLTAVNPEGEELPLGTFPIESLHHVELSLRQLLAGFRDAFSAGSIRMRVLGDADALQGWAVVRGDRTGTVSFRIATPESATDREYFAFWGSRSASSEHSRRPVDLYLLNASDTPVTVTISAPGKTADKVPIAASSRARVRVSDDPNQAGLSWVRIAHDGNPGDLQVIGMAGAEGPLSRIGVVGRSELAADQRFDSLPLPGSVSAERSSLTLFNPGQELRSVTVEVLDARTGTERNRRGVRVRGESTRTIPLASVIRGIEDPVRLRVTADEPPILASVTTWSGGYPREVSLFPYQKVHAQGTYPLPNLKDFKTVTTLVNLSSEDAGVAFQVYWAGGTYAIAPMIVPAGASRTIDLEKIADEQLPDLLGRALDPLRPEGVVKWRAMTGDTELIGRTTVEERHREDGLGFDCYGCCQETATGSILPSEVSFTTSQSPGFESCVTIEDCSGGVMGPYHSYPSSTSVSSPFSWDTYNISASSAADGGVSFTGSEQVMAVTCQQKTVGIFGFGKAKMCQKTFNPKGYDGATKTCQQQTQNCLDCRDCCDALAAEKLCKGKNKDMVEGERQACDTECQGYYVGNGCER